MPRCLLTERLNMRHLLVHSGFVVVGHSFIGALCDVSPAHTSSRNHPEAGRKPY